jgi:hypothetical protein
METPPHLRNAVQLLVAYMANDRDIRTCVAVGQTGCGRGYWIDEVCRVQGLVPLWLHDYAPVPTTDLMGRKLLPVYDLGEWHDGVGRGVVLLDSTDQVPPSDRRSIYSIGFPPPPEPVRRAFLRAHGAPESLALGNLNYAALTTAARVFAATGEEVACDVSTDTGWTAFRTGGKPPVDGPLLAYYAAYRFDPKNWDWNHLLWLSTRTASPIPERIMQALRLGWGDSSVAFPSLLRTARRAPDRASDPSPPKRGSSVPSKPDYRTTW